MLLFPRGKIRIDSTHQLVIILIEKVKRASNLDFHSILKKTFIKSKLTDINVTKSSTYICVKEKNSRLELRRE